MYKKRQCLFYPLCGCGDGTAGKKGNVYFSYVTDSVSDMKLDADMAMVMRQTDELVEVIYANTRSNKGWLWQVGYIMRSGISGYIAVPSSAVSQASSPSTSSPNCW